MLSDDDRSECEKCPCDHCPILNLSAGKHPQGKKEKKKKKTLQGYRWPQIEQWQYILDTS